MKKQSANRALFKGRSRANNIKASGLLVAREKPRKPHKVVFNSKELRALEEANGKVKKALVKEIKNRYGI